MGNILEVKIEEGVMTVNEKLPHLEPYMQGVSGVNLKGRAAFGNAEFADFFSRYVEGQGDYIEIGTLFGASACLAGFHCKGEVHCIDPLGGYYGAGRKDKSTGLLPTPEIVIHNWEQCGHDPERLHIHQQINPPFPEELKDKRFDVGFIDGDHTFAGCLADWMALKDRVDKFIIFDNAEKEEVRIVIEMAVRTSVWAVNERQKGHDIYAVALRRET